MASLEKELFKRIYMDSPIGIELFDSEGKLLDINKACLNIFGVSDVTEVKEFELFKDPNIPEGEMEKLKSGETIRYEIEFDFEKVKKFNLYKTTKSGIINLDVLITPLFTDEIKSVNYLVQVQDITKHKKADKEIREIRDFYKNILDGVVNGVWVTNKDDIIYYTNKGMEKIAGISSEQIVGAKVLTDFPKSTLKDFIQYYLKTKDTLKPVFYDAIYIVTPSGRPSYQSGWLIPRIKDGKYDGIICTAEDITERKETEQKLKESEEKLKKLNKELEQSVEEKTREIETFKNISDNANYGIGMINLNGNLIYVNEYFAAIHGYKPEELIGKELSIFHTQEQLNLVMALKKELEVEGSYNAKEVWHKHKDGSVFPMLMNGIMIKDNKDEPILMAATAIDITKHKKAEEKIQYQAKLVEDVSDAIISTDLEFNIISWNKAAESIYGWKADEARGKNIMDIIPVEYPYDDLETVLKDFSENGFWGGEVIQQRKDGTPINLLSSVSVFKDKKEKPVGAVAINRDITERKKAEEKIKDVARFPSENPNPVLRLAKETVFYANDAGQSLFNIQEGSNIPDLLRAHVNDSISNNVRQNVDIEIKDRIFSFSITPIKEAGYANLYGRDITEHKHAELKIKESEERYRSLYEEAPNAYFSIGPDKSILGHNKTAEMLLGYTKEEFSKMKVIDLYADTKNGSEKAKNIFQRFLQGEKIQDEELQMKKKSGESFWISLTVKPILDQSGNVIESRSMVIDINKRKEAEEKLKESERKFRTIFEANPDLFFLLSEDTTILEYNGPREDLYLPSEEFLGKKMNEVLPKNVAELFKASVNLTFKTKKPQIIEYILPIRNENCFFEARLLYFSENRITVFIRNITERKQAEHNLKDSEENYHEAYNKSNFYKDILMHDISNVLQNVQSSVELFPVIQNKLEDIKDVDNLIDIIQKSVDRGTKLISNVRKLSQLEDVEILLQSTELCKILEESIRFLRKSFQEKEIVVQIESPDKQLHVKANELLLDVIENILINAAKYNNNSIVYILIKIFKERRQNINYIRIDFIDNGIGIPEANKKAIFQKGFKKDTKIRGMGIGLSLVKKVVESYNGQIWVEDKVKGDYTQGSNFIVLIPEAE